MSEHPSIAAVLARHLADNHVKPNAVQGAKLANMEKAIKNINARLDSIQSSVECLELYAKSDKLDLKFDKKTKKTKGDKDKQEKDE